MTPSNVKKIVLLCRALSIGGAEKQLLLLAQGLQKKGHTVTVLTFYQSKEDYKTDGLNIITLKKKYRWDVFAFLKTLLHTIRTENADVIYSFLCVPNILICLLKAFRLLQHKRIIIGFRGSFMKWSDYGLIEWLTAKVEAYAARFANAVIANSHAGLLELKRRGFKTKHTYAIQNGVDTDTYKPNRENGKAWRSRYNIPLDIPLVGIVARLDPMKNHRMFLKVAKIVYEQNKNIRFAIVGTGKNTYQDELKSFQKQINLPTENVYWVNCGSDVNYNAFDVLCLTSAYGEGFSNVLCEALSSGIPCIATNVGDAALILNDDNNIVAPEDVKNMAQKVLKQLEIPYSEGNAITLREKITSHYTIDKMISKTEEILKNENEK